MKRENVLHDSFHAQPVTAVSIEGETHVMQRGDTQLLTIVLQPEDAETGTACTWTSTDSGVAFVDDENVLRAIGGGTADIIVSTGNGLTAVYPVEVQVAIESMSFTVPAFLPIGETAEPECNILPLSATNKVLAWENSDETVVSIDSETGIITALSEGTAVITATAHNGLTSAQTVEVYRPVETLTLTATSGRLFTLEPGNTMQISAGIEPADATDQTVQWSSSNESILTVNEEGLVTAIGPGTTTVRALAGSRFDQQAEVILSITVIDFDSVVTLPAMLTVIEEEAFTGDNAVQAIVLGDRVTTIQSRAFSDMDNLTYVLIPASVTDIAEDAFSGTDAVIVTPADSWAAEWAAAHDMDLLDKRPTDNYICMFDQTTQAALITRAAFSASRRRESSSPSSSPSSPLYYSVLLWNTSFMFTVAFFSIESRTCV